MQHYKTGLVIGRFQPFHNGHAYLIKKALEFCDALIIAIGSVNKTDADNPWSTSIRKKMIERFVEEEKLTAKVHKIVLLDDCSDADWVQQVSDKAPADVVVGNNEWVNHLLAKAGYAVLPLPYLDRFLYEGKKIRKDMKEGKEWESRVPSYITPLLHTL